MQDQDGQNIDMISSVYDSLIWTLQCSCSDHYNDRKLGPNFQFSIFTYEKAAGPIFVSVKSYWNEKENSNRDKISYSSQNALLGLKVHVDKVMFWYISLHCFNGGSNSI